MPMPQAPLLTFGPRQADIAEVELRVQTDRASPGQDSD